MAMFVVDVDLPPVALSPNERVDRRTKARATARYRELVGFLAVAERHRTGWEAPAKARVSLVWGMKGARPSTFRPRDPDNAVAAAKALFDGLRDAGIIVDDNWAALELGSVTATFQAGPWVRVLVEAVQAGVVGMPPEAPQ